MRYIPILKFFSEEFVDVDSTATAVADADGHLADTLLSELPDARIEEEIKALRKWDVL